MPTVYEILSRDYSLTEVLTCSRFTLPDAMAGLARTVGGVEEFLGRCREARRLLSDSFPEEVKNATHQAGMLYYEFLHAEELYERIIRQGAALGLSGASFADFVRWFGLPQDEEVKAQVVRRGHQFLDEAVHAVLSKHPVEFLADVEMLAKYRMVDRAFALLDEGLAARSEDPDARRILLERGVELCERLGRPDKRNRYTSELSAVFRAAGDLNLAESLQVIKYHTLPIQLSSTGIPGFVDITPEVPAPLEGGVLLYARLAGMGLFDVVQHVENLRMTAALDLFSSRAFIGRVSVFEGRIVDALTDDGYSALEGLRMLVRWIESAESKDGSVVVRELKTWNVTIVVNSNMSLLLDLLREFDESNHEAATAAAEEW